ncbi:hypothetical protein O3G_MSEX013270 [Manduca sexta]|uniref:Uncharacterized protein n=1 Tax=Manduca sexta TaxID=7130 RepID=A0A921ZS80_MANSE|nr:hypothetical protein O3G_MSEX013270 [Manduca sexta]
MDPRGKVTISRTLDVDDSSVFMASLVAIRLQRNDGTVLWENDRPSSTFYLRSIMFKFTKETQTTVAALKAGISREIETLQPTTLKKVKIVHELMMTMIDGKITSYLSETSTVVCDICKAKPTQMNNLESHNLRDNDEEMYQYGLSSLHAWIKCMECLLHIAYRLEVKKWSCRGDDKDKIKIRKSAIQRAFKEECGLLIDVVKQGAGSTNDGNTARRFLKNKATTARITGINEQLIENFYVILQAIASGERVDHTKFSIFCNETAELYVKLYPWYYMPSSVHKLLMHGADIIKHFGAIPIGKLSEEAAEARNKDFRHYRENHSRKINRIATNEDIFHNLLLSSDPKITSLRPRMTKQNVLLLSPKAKELLHLSTEPEELEFINIESNLENLQNSSDSE